DHPTDLSGVDPALAALADNGGPTPTRLPHPGSPAIDRIPPGTPLLCDGTDPVDQRGVHRPQGDGCDVGAVEGQGTSVPGQLHLVVTPGGDAVDAAPGDGVCQDATGPAGACSLRAAIDEANAWAGPDTIAIPPGTITTIGRLGDGENHNA